MGVLNSAFGLHRVMLHNQVIFECGVMFCDHCSIEHESSKGTCIFAFIAAFAFILLFKPPIITQFIHKFPFGEIFLLTDLYFYNCETELFNTN